MTDRDKLINDITSALFKMAQEGFLKSITINTEHDFDALRIIGGPAAYLGSRTMISTPEKLSVDALAEALLAAGWRKDA